MRNLYSRINVRSDASTAELKTAISACPNEQTKVDASAVLLCEDRRHTYDRVNDTLTDIGHLRGSLGLTHTENWFGDVSAEYTHGPLAAESKRAEFIQKIKRSQFRTANRTSISSTSKSLIGLSVVCMSIIAAIWVNYPSPETFETPGATYSAPALPLPHTGTTRRYTATAAVAPLEVRAGTGSHYLLRLLNVASGRNVMDVFIRSGTTVNVNVPLGAYIAKYATGTTWYGYTYYFGPETAYKKADTTFHFRNDGYQITGYTITLYRVAHGNLGTSGIRASEF